MKRSLQWSAVVVTAVLGLTLLTPLGPAALTEVLERGSGAWRIGVGKQRGAVLFGFSFADIHCQNTALGLDITIGSLAFRPWSWAVEVREPRVRIEPVAAAKAEVAEPPADIELPISLLPKLSVTGGHLTWHFDGSALIARDWQVSYQAVDDTSGLLEIALPAIEGLETVRSLQLDLMLSAHRVDIGVFEMAGGSDSLAYAARASLALGLALPRPLQGAIEATVDGLADSLQGILAVTIDGALEPLQLRGQLNATGRLPTLADIALQGEFYTDGDRFDLDDLLISLLDGELTGRASYVLASDHLQTQLQGRGFDLVGASPVGGRADFDLAATLQLEQQRFSADFSADLRDLELLQGERFDLKLKAEHQLDGATHLTLDSRLLALAAVGTADLAGGYDLELAGTLWPAALLAGAAPIELVGQARPDTLALQLAAAHLPGAMGRAFGPLRAELDIFANRHLEALVQLERDLVVARAAIDITEQRVDTLVVAVAGFVLERLVPGLAGQLDVELAGSGGLALDQLQLAGIATTTVLHYADWHSGGLALDFAWDRGGAQGELSGPAWRMLAALDAQQYLHVQTKFAGPVLSQADGGEVALAGELDWAGPLGDLHAARGQLALNAFSLHQGSWALNADGPLVVDYRDGRFDFTAVHLQTPVGLLDLSGWAGFDSLAVNAAWPTLTLDELVPDLSAVGTAKLRLGGTMTRPEAQASVALAAMRLDTLSLGGASLQLVLADSLIVKADAEAGLHLVLSCPAAPLLGEGTGRALFEIEAVAADLGPVLSYALGHPLRGRLDLGGMIEVALADSLLDWNHLSGHVDLRDMAIETEVDADSLRLDLLTGGQFVLGGGRLALDSLVVAMQRYDRDLRALRPAGIMRLGGELAAVSSRIGLALEEVELVFFGGPEGLANLTAEVSGTATEPELAVELAVNTEDFGELRGRLSGDGRGGDLHLNWTTLIEDSLVVVGRVPWDLAAATMALDQGWLEAHSEGIGLFVFADLNADLDYLDGRIGADLRVEGLDSTLAISGQIGIEGLQFALLDIEPIYVLPDGQLQFNGRAVELVGFAVDGEPERGYRSLELSGRMDLAELYDPRFDLQLVVERLACRYEDIFQADDIRLDLSFAGAVSSSKLAGNIRLNSPRSEPTFVVFNAPPVPPPPPALRDEFFENMALAVGLDLRSLSLDSELAKVEASGAIEVGGTFYKPLFQGDVGIEQGHILVLNQQFEFEEGRVIFNSLEPTGSILDVTYDPLELNPELDLRATTLVLDHQDDNEEYTVTLTLQGRAKEVAPQFTSVPVKNFTEIVNLLAFGTTSTQGVGSALGTVAGQLLSKRVEKVGFDEFVVLPSSTVLGAKPGAALQMGKYFSGLPLPLWVRYEALLSEMSSGEVRVEHKLKSFLTLTGSAHSEYDRYGLGIGLKKDF